MTDQKNKPQIGVSACLLGKNVRFDGGHKQNRFVLDQCSEYFDLYSVCPEVELGLGIPRPVIQLRSFDAEIKLVYSKNPENELTEPMREFSYARINKLEQLDGFIFKKDSPTCGMERVPVFNNNTGMRQRNGVGIFAGTFKQLHPDVPTEEEGRLGDVGIRENFLERIYAHYRWRQIENSDNKLHSYREFHKNYKYMLMAKNPVSYRELGALMATLNKHNYEKVCQQYFSRFMQIMAKIPTRGNHVNVLMHIQGYLKNKLDTKEKQELLTWLENYKKQQANRTTPIALLQHHFLHHPNKYIAEQYYFSSFPTELMQPV